jgi:anti-anti-sigma factor
MEVRMGSERQVGTVKVELVSSDTAIVALVGEHDLYSHDGLRATLASASEGRNVLVDLSRCTFIDSAILSLLLATQRSLTTRGARCELIVPPESGYVTRLFEVSGVADLFRVHASRNAGFASISGSPSLANAA